MVIQSLKYHGTHQFGTIIVLYGTNQRSNFMNMVNLMVPSSYQLELSNRNLSWILGRQMANVRLCEPGRHAFSLRA